MLRRKTRARRGFNLIEAAIVLGVVGLVIGGIWVAAAAVSENMKVNDTLNGVATTANNVQRLISFADATVMNEDITPDVIDTGIFPTDWVANGSITHPFNGAVTFKNLHDSFVVRLWDIPKSACIKITSKLSSLGSGSTLLAIYFDPANMGTSNFPITPAQTAIDCADGLNTLHFVYSYTRNN